MAKLARINTTLQTFFGLITLLSGGLMMWGSVKGERADLSTIGTLSSDAVDIDASIPSARDNGKLVVAAAGFSADQQLEDEYLKAGPYLILRRRVEMYQWVEERNVGVSEPQYAQAWQEGEVDFFNFAVPDGHENPVPRATPIRQMVQSARFGGYDGSVLLQSIVKLLPLTLEPGMLKDQSLVIEDNKILIPRPGNIETPGLGDMRVSYEVLPQGDYTVMTRQVDERTLLGTAPSDTLLIRPGLFTAESLSKAQTSEVRSGIFGMLCFGALLLFAGLLSILSPLAKNLDLRPRLPFTGTAALAVVCAAISLAAFGVMGTLALLS
jgi:hypothetical protein